MRIEFTAARADRRLAKQIVRRIPTGVRIGQPARLENPDGSFAGWAIHHPNLDGIDAIRLAHVCDQLADNDPAFTDPDLDDDGKITGTEVRAMRDRIDADPVVDAAIKAYRKALRGADK